MSNCMPLDFLIDYNKKYPNIWKYTEEFQSEKDLWDDSVCYFPIGASMGILQEFYNVPFPLLKKHSNSVVASKSPHIRKAHWHHYWVGKENEKSKILKWLHPMFINPQKGKKTDKNKED